MPEHMQGRGVVIVGGGKFLPSAYVALKKLRATGCSLPVEFWYLGPSEFPLKLTSQFDSLGAACIDAFKMRERYPMRRLGGWECKPYAIAYSGFEEVLLVDADNLVLRDPTFLFTDPLYLSTTALFWPDFPPREDSFWRINQGAFELLGLPVQLGLEIESGQLLIHKRKSWEALTSAVSMNEASDFFYNRCSHGDKDLFTLAWLVTHTPYGRIQKLPQIVRDFIRTQYGPDGIPLFEHGRKWVLPVEANRATGPSLHDDTYFEWLTEFSRAMYV